jgi:hypothetical protein
MVFRQNRISWEDSGKTRRILTRRLVRVPCCEQRAASQNGFDLNRPIPHSKNRSAANQWIRSVTFVVRLSSCHQSAEIIAHVEKEFDPKPIEGVEASVGDWSTYFQKSSLQNLYFMGGE